MTGVSAGSRISLKNILLATDFSPSSQAALPHALSIAMKYGAKLYPAHVIHLSPFPNSSPTLAWQAVASQAAREAQKAMDAIRQKLANIPHEVLFRRGEIWTELSRVVAEKEIDLIVAGTHGRTGVSKMLLGSAAEEIFRHAPCPVLTVGPHVSASPKGVAESHEILFATDLTPHSLAAAPYAISLAQQNQVRLSLLHVIREMETNLSSEVVKERLRALVPAEAEFWCRPNYFVRHGLPEAEILDLAGERAVDLIVLGVRPVRGIPRIATHLPWTIAHRIVIQAHCPVLTIRG
jgi:nucleotide-binding universal stress UspA family protein